MFNFFLLVVSALECYANEDCRPSEVCHTGTCVSACLVLKCGARAICTPTLHDIDCSCPPGLTGNAQVACTLRNINSPRFCIEVHMHGLISALIPTLAPILSGCHSNDDCPDHNACKNRICINPCESVKCKPTATCKVVAHHDTCICPNGYIGTPETSCELRK